MRRLNILVLSFCILVLPAAAQKPVVGGVVSAASFAAGEPLASGSLVAIFGTSLATSTVGAPGFPLATSLAGATVTFDGVAAPLIFVSSGQINVQVPWGLSGDSSSLVVTVNGVASDAFTVGVGPSSPGVFVTGQGFGAINLLASDGTFKGQVGPNNPARPGDILSIFATGLGAATNPPASGAAALTNPLSQAVLPGVVKLGGVVCRFLFAGLAPGFAGLYQINAVVPAAAPSGSAVSLTLSAGSRVSPGVNVVVQSAAPPAPPQITTLSGAQASPAARLTVTGSGLDPLAPTVINFSDTTGYSANVRATQVTATSATSLVPPYFNASTRRFAAGTVSVRVVQTLAGQSISSNALGGFQIQDLPALTLVAGKLAAATLSAMDQNMQEMIGKLLFASLGATGSNSQVSGKLTDLSSRTLLLAGSAQVASQTGNTLLLGNIDGQLVNFDSTVMSAMDRLIAALLLQQAAGASPAPDGPSAAAVPCKPPAMLELEDLVQKGDNTSPVAPYQTQWQNCVSQGLVVDDFSGLLERGAAWSTLLASLPPSFGPSPLVVGLALSNLYSAAAAQGVGASLAGGSSPNQQVATALGSLAQRWDDLAANLDVTGAVRAGSRRVQKTSTGDLFDWVTSLEAATADTAALVERLGMPFVKSSGGATTLSQVQIQSSFNVVGSAKSNFGRALSSGSVTLGASSSPSPPMPGGGSSLAAVDAAALPNRLPSALGTDGSFLFTVPSAQVGQALPAQSTLRVKAPDFTASNVPIDLRQGAQTVPAFSLQPSPQSTFSGTFTESGTDVCSRETGVTSPITGSGIVTVTLQPALSPLATSGGSFSGTSQASGFEQSCGSTRAVLDSGTVTGSVRPGGAVSFTVTLPNADLPPGFVFPGSGTPTALAGGASITDPNLPGFQVNVSFFLANR